MYHKSYVLREILQKKINPNFQMDIFQAEQFWYVLPYMP